MIIKAFGKFIEIRNIMVVLNCLFVSRLTSSSNFEFLGTKSRFDIL